MIYYGGMIVEANPKTINVAGLCNYLGVSRSVAYNLVHIKGFPAIRVGKRIIIPVQLLNRWMEDNAGKIVELA